MQHKHVHSTMLASSKRWKQSIVAVSTGIIGIKCLGGNNFEFGVAACAV